MCCNVDRPWERAQWNKPNTKGHWCTILLQKSRISKLKNWTWTADCQGLGMGRRVERDAHGFLSRWWEFSGTEQSWWLSTKHQWADCGNKRWTAPPVSHRLLHSSGSQRTSGSTLSKSGVSGLCCRVTSQTPCGSRSWQVGHLGTQQVKRLRCHLHVIQCENSRFPPQTLRAPNWHHIVQFLSF